MLSNDSAGGDTSLISQPAHRVYGETLTCAQIKVSGLTAVEDINSMVLVCTLSGTSLAYSGRVTQGNCRAPLSRSVL